VQEAIQSVQQQDYPNIEIIVIDDGSTDNTPQVLSGLHGIIYVRQKNQGLSAARNQGMQIAKGKYLQFLDADDLLGPMSIRTRLNFLEQNPEKSAVICRSAFFGKRMTPKYQEFRHAEWRQPEANQVDLALYHFNIAPPHAFFVRMSTVQRHAMLFDTRLRACEDYDFWFRLAQVSGLPGMVRSCWVYYRQHSNNMSRSYANQFRHDAELCKRIFAASDVGKPLLGRRPPTDYLSAMLAASLLTCRRLWFVDRPAFDDFLSGHVHPLLHKLYRSQQSFPATFAAKRYLASARLTMLNMWLHDHSIDESFYDLFKRSFPLEKSFFASAIGFCRRSISIPTLIRTLKLDFYSSFFVLPKSFHRHFCIIIKHTRWKNAR
jgi:glycosyltransferase involved in cell wall biosynthesis